MIRKSMLALGLAAGLFGAAELAGQANAAEPRVNVSFGGPNWSVGFSNGGYFPTYGVSSWYPPVNHHYHVYYRTCAHEPWRLYSTYHSHSRAHEVVDRLEWSGYQARMAHQ